LAPVVAAFQASDGDIRRTLAAIARSPAFLSDRSVRQKLKDPVDYTIGIMRATGVGSHLLSLRTEMGTFENPLPQRIHIELYHFLNCMDRQGMRLLFPPDPSGWKQGQVWASSDTMAARQVLALPFATPDKGNQVVLETIRHFVATGNPRDGAQILSRICLFFDWDLKPATIRVIAEAWRGNAHDLVSDLWTFYHPFLKTLSLAAAAPETHFC
jgi:hypothetical protein